MTKLKYYLFFPSHHVGSDCLNSQQKLFAEKHNKFFQSRSPFICWESVQIERKLFLIIWNANGYNKLHLASLVSL